MCSTNLTWSNVLNVQETVTYRPSPVNSKSATDFSQEAKITALCGGWQKIKNKVEEASVERFSQNAKRGREGFETVLEMSRRVFGEQREIEKRTHDSSTMVSPVGIQTPTIGPRLYLPCDASSKAAFACTGVRFFSLVIFQAWCKRCQLHFVLFSMFLQAGVIAFRCIRAACTIIMRCMH